MRFLSAFTIILFLFELVTFVRCCGFPSGGGSVGGGGGGGCCCCPSGGGGGGYGGGGGCGRRRRREISPHFYRDGEKSPCPMSHWQILMEKSIEGNDVITSISTIQTTLTEQFPQNKFSVICGENPTINHATEQFQNVVHFKSSGDAYCNVFNEKVWCQAAALYS